MLSWYGRLAHFAGLPQPLPQQLWVPPATMPPAKVPPRPRRDLCHRQTIQKLPATLPILYQPKIDALQPHPKNIITLSPNIHATTLKSTACIGMLTPSRNKHVRHTHNRTPHNTRHTLASPVVSDIRTCSFIATCNHNLLSDPSSPNLTRLIKCKIIYVTVTSCWLCSCIMVRARSQQSANIAKLA